MLGRVTGSAMPVLATGSSVVAFVEGPPKIVATDPAPGSRVGPGQVGRVLVAFHKDVSASASAFTLGGARTGAVPVAFAYDRGTATVTLTPAAALGPDEYTLTVSDSVTDAASGQALDGEIPGRGGTTALPSGDGQPGGSASVRFEVTRPVRRHVNAVR